MLALFSLILIILIILCFTADKKHRNHKRLPLETACVMLLLIIGFQSMHNGQDDKLSAVFNSIDTNSQHNENLRNSDSENELHGVPIEESFDKEKPEDNGFTLLIYMTGSDLESNNGAASEDLREMMKYVDTSNDEEVIVMAGGSKSWKDLIDQKHTNIYQICSNDLILLQEGDRKNMGDENTLAGFLQYCYQNNPDTRKALIIWDHGAGPMIGCSFDELHKQNGQMDGLTLEELDNALMAGIPDGERMEWIGFDCCLMASLETAVVIAPYAKYMVASEDLEPKDGWDYSFLGSIADHNNQKIVEKIVDAYMEHNEETMTPVTLSAIDLQYVPIFQNKLSDFFHSMEWDENLYKEVARARIDVVEAGGTAPFSYDLIDLKDFLERLQEKKIGETSELTDCLQNVVIATGSNRRKLHGLSIYYPFYNKEKYLSPWSNRMTNIDVSKGYVDFISASSGAWLEDSYNVQRFEQPTGIYESDKSTFSLQLSDDAAANFADAKLLILSEKHPGEYTKIYEVDHVDRHSSELYTDYSGEALFFTDINGAPTTDTISYRRDEDILFIPAYVYTIGGPRVKTRNIILVYHVDEENNVALIDTVVEDEDGIGYGKSEFDLGEFDIIQFSGTGKTVSMNPNGTVLSYENWNDGKTIVGVELDVKDIAERIKCPEFLAQRDGYDRYAMFELTDVMGNTVGSELFLIPDLKRYQILIEDIKPVEYEGYSYKIEKVECVDRDDNLEFDSLEITYSAENNTDEILTFRADNFILDNLTLDQSFFGNIAYRDAGEHRPGRMYFTSDTFERLPAQHTNTLQFELSVYDSSSRLLSNDTISLKLDLDVTILRD